MLWWERIPVILASTWLLLSPFDLILHDVMLCHVIPYHVMSCHLLWYDVMSYHIISHYNMSCDMIRYDVISCHIISFISPPPRYYLTVFHSISLLSYPLCKVSVRVCECVCMCMFMCAHSGTCVSVCDFWNTQVCVSVCSGKLLPIKSS